MSEAERGVREGRKGVPERYSDFVNGGAELIVFDSKNAEAWVSSDLWVDLQNDGR